jgi:transposase-like protein
MEVKKRRKFEIGFKRQLVAQIESGQLSVMQAARTHEVSPTVIQYWRKKFRAGSLSEGPSLREKELEKEVAHYKRLLAEAHAQLDIQKKYGDWIRQQRKLSTSVVTGLSSRQFPKDVEQ